MSNTEKAMEAARLMQPLRAKPTAVARNVQKLKLPKSVATAIETARPPTQATQASTLKKRGQMLPSRAGSKATS